MGCVRGGGVSCSLIFVFITLSRLIFSRSQLICSIKFCHVAGVLAFFTISPHRTAAPPQRPHYKHFSASTPIMRMAYTIQQHSQPHQHWASWRLADHDAMHCEEVQHLSCTLAFWHTHHCSPDRIRSMY